ncbi:MAG TPA: hypothetical protein VLF62_02175 [Candidatus Saccharimonadales bacterium]|nr:hypothetical protein [Candidatus Saccharimonadales bacterium]
MKEALDQPATKKDLLELKEWLVAAFSDSTSQILSAIAAQMARMDRRTARLEGRVNRHDRKLDDHEVRLRDVETFH